MECRQVELGMPEGHMKDVTVCKGVNLPYHVKGATNKEDLVVINKYLDDLRELGVSYPELCVEIHELYHIMEPEKSEYEIREMTDKEYERITGERINTVAYFSSKDYLNYANGANREFD